MGVLGTAASKAVDAATGATHGTNLEEFLTKFSSTAGVFVDTIDPLHTFEVEFKFFPTEFSPHEGAVPDADDNKGWLEKLGSSLANSAMDAVNNLGDSLTGGMLGSIINSNKPKLSELRTSNMSDKKTFMGYLAEGNLLVNSNNYMQQAIGMSNGSNNAD